ncbi:MAG: acyl-CoA dehydrogenase family protein, partial [Burkholderiales bacterium]|nr:acyl-CoA dehydrogenase family protein [Burkholderiales bacterium]
MPLVLTEEQSMLRDSARNFLADNAPVSQLRQLRDTKDELGYSKALWQRFAEMGFTGILVPEAHGGLGLGFVEAGVVMEEIGHNLTASPFFASSVVAVTAIRHAGSQAQQAALLPALASGERIATLALDEHSKHNPARIECQATLRGDGWVIDGAKRFVVDGHVADLLIVAARTSADGLTLFAVPRSTAGITVERTAMVDAHNAARVAFSNVAVGADAVLGTVGQGATALQAALNAGRACAAAEMVGLADEVFERTVVYLKERKQFDRLIGEFQGLQHRAAALYCDIELARAATAKALEALDDDAAQATSAVAVAKARAGSSATLAVQEGVQMHGGMGMTDDIGRTHGAKTFLVYEDERATFEAFCRATLALAAALADEGVVKGDRIAIAMRNLPEWPVAFFATLLLGAIAVPVNAWWTEPELEYALTDSGAKLAIVDGERLARIAPALPRCPALRRVLVARATDTIADPRVQRLEDAIGTVADWPALPEGTLPTVAL